MVRPGTHDGDGDVIEQVFIPDGLAYEPIEGMTLLWRTTARGADLGGAIPRTCHGVEGEIQGTAFFMDPATRSTTLSFLDQIHGVGASPFVRTIAMTSAGPAHAWHWNGDADREYPLAAEAEAGHAEHTN